jgi:tripartite-type tricarboxylate transporter receptor subunit TctC
MKKQLLIIAVAAFACVTSAIAEPYPTRPITFVVPFAAGGPADTLARRLAEPISAALGQSIVIENVVGAAGSIGVGRVAHAAPDGYTVGIGNWSTHVVNGVIYPLPYDLLKDLAPVAVLPRSPQLIVTRGGLPVNNLAQLVAWVKANKATVGTAGIGSATHVSGLFFQNVVGGESTFVSYRSAGHALQDLVAGHIDLMFDQAANSMPFVRAGTIKAHAVTSDARLRSAPDIPTVDEAGLPKFYVSVWYGLWLPKGTSPDIVAKLNSAVVKALADPVWRKQSADLGQDMPEPDQQTPAALAALQKAEIDKWWPMLKAANIKAQ